MRKNIWKTVGKMGLGAVILYASMTVLTVIAVILFMLGGQGVESLFQGKLETASLSTLKGQFAYAIFAIQSASFILAAWLMWLCFERKSGFPLGWRGGGKARNALAGAAAGAAAISIAFLLIWAFGGLFVKSFNADSLPFLALWAPLFALAAVSEEVASRGYAQSLLTRYFGAKAAMAGSAIFFAVLHFDNRAVFSTWMPVASLLAAGAFFAVLREKTGSLWTGIGVHFAWNFMQGNVFGFSVSGNAADSILEIERSSGEIVSGGAFGAEGSVFGLLAMAALLVWALKMKKREEAKDAV